MIIYLIAILFRGAMFDKWCTHICIALTILKVTFKVTCSVLFKNYR